MKTLAVKYRPSTFDDVVEQDTIKRTLLNQIQTKTIKNCYLFCGPAGCSKTTQARIFAKELNGSSANIVELDAASHSGVDNFRGLLEESRLKPIGTPYRIFIVDECHALSSSAWQAALKSTEEPTPTSIFIFCTTDPQKIPKTILSRVQRFNFKRISLSGIKNRLKFIISKENEEGNNFTYTEDAIDYIGKLADGGMRDSIKLLEQTLDYCNDVTIETVTKAIGTVDYGVMFELTDCFCKFDKKRVIEIVETVYRDGVDLKQFIKNYLHFVLDLTVYDVIRDFDYIQIPNTYETRLKQYTQEEFQFFVTLLDTLLKLNSDIKWDGTPKPHIIATFVILCSEG